MPYQLKQFSTRMKWDIVALGFDPSLSRIGAAAAGRRGAQIIPLFAAWGDVEGKTRGEKIFNLGLEVDRIRDFFLEEYYATGHMIGVENSFMGGDSDAFRTLIMAEAAIRRSMDFGSENFRAVSNSTWKSVILGKPSSVGKKSWDKTDIENILREKYSVDIPFIDRGIWTRGKNKGQRKLEHNDSFDALGIALYLLEADNKSYLTKT